MIKFWKSAAKGKSGCPVRPPEADTLNNSTIKLVTVDENDFGNCNIFEKKSQLSLTLHDILIEKKCIKHFVSYMESIEKHFLISCWLELENYRIYLIHIPHQNLSNCHNKINHSKSLDDNSIFPNIDTKHEGFNLQEPSNWKASCNSLNRNKIETCSEYDNNKFVNITEQAISLFKKYVALEAPHKLKLTDDIRKVVISNICGPEGKIREDCFKPVQDVLFCEMESLFSGFQSSPNYIKAQIDILTSGCINLKDILYNETILFYFTEYLEQECSSTLLEFLMNISHFKENITNGVNANVDQYLSDAIVIYEKYFSLQATCPIGFPTDVRLKVESDICTEKGPMVTCFDAPYRIIYKTLSIYVKTFLESEIYYTYLSEMIKSVDQLWSSNCKSSLHSDCSSEFSLSTQNTLLVMGDTYLNKKRNHSVPDMTIDSNQLYNADALWQRKKHDGLSLGRINSLGRFESKFEPDPDKKNKSVLRKMVNKFVPTNSSNMKEEMAWQIAHMIVKDVTDLTMAPQDNDHE